LRGEYDDRANESIFLGYATNGKGYRCFNKRLYKLVDCIDLKVDEGVPVREVRNIESTTEDTAEAEDEQVQESSISFQDQAHPHKIPFSEREGHQ
jgi:DNA-binding transcriptional MerR regulator